MDEAELLRRVEYSLRLLLHRTPIPKGSPLTLPEPIWWPWEEEKALEHRRAQGMAGDEVPYDEVQAEMMARAGQ